MTEKRVTGALIVDEDALSTEEIEKLENLGVVIIRKKPQRHVEIAGVWKWNW